MNPTPSSPGQRLRILIVDDNRDAADTLAALIGMWGYETRVAYDGEAGLCAAREQPPDCILLDIAMPRMHGYELARRVRAESELSATRLVALTASLDPKRAAEAGFDHQLTKPADLGELRRVLEMLEQITRLAETTERLARQNVDLASQTKDLLQEVKQEVEEVRDEVREVKQEVRELKAEMHANKPTPDQAEGTQSG
ncbi:MAG TPA: response regulator [Gemmataceae bacterium]|nr:response regulator [Gemmataceae bacterium]